MKPLLTQQQLLLIAPLRCGHPVPVERLIAVLYAWRADGGPDDAASTVHTQVGNMRQRLAPYGVAILTIGRGPGALGYMVDPGHTSRLEALLDTEPCNVVAALPRAADRVGAFY